MKMRIRGHSRLNCFLTSQSYFLLSCSRNPATNFVATNLEFSQNVLFISIELAFVLKHQIKTNNKFTKKNIGENSGSIVSEIVAGFCEQEITREIIGV